MRIIVTKDYDELSKYAANIIASQVRLKSDSVIGLATGSTPIGAYQELIRQCKEENLDFSEVKTFNLDEYVGLEADHNQSYRHFMNHQLFNHINIPMENTHVPNGKAEDELTECKSYDEKIKAAGHIDLQLLGMGSDGHIGFNEPNDSFVVSTNVVDLQQPTIDANSRFFASADEVPRQAITMGYMSIMQAQRILFVVSGKSKAEVVKQALQGPVTPQVPASILQLHRDVIVVLDEEAASELA